MSIRIPEETDAELARLAERLPATTKSGLARVLLERALRDLGGDVSQLVRPQPQGPTEPADGEK